ncbi:AfsR/SARP family transcriptional regulator [Actinocrispum wychmicini]|uniref:DNA-binding SARP family transcriptional activator n=1 Tax=Actinocrispum wychmicini TaxID=1213861 RepID=A0A4R2JTN5_9PSEU|nr:AfsR/SARP family transcriptional regulator [Actinocrispum wychmicini]TCO62352.1 DNA-binding SARP family transcriptional activator [Actinocrispum wychmicini]
MLRLLGPLELVVDRLTVDVGGPRQRVVLAMLALNANRVTTVDQLVDAIWDTSPPSTARAQIQTCVSALRKLIGASTYIRTRPAGYLLEITGDDLDTEVFATLLGQARDQADAGRLDQAAATLRTALGLWRGPALAGVPSDLVQRGAALLEERRLAALEECARLDLALGRHERIIGELRSFVDEHPLRERLYGLLMLALYRSGRQAEALEVCRRARTMLVTEMGIELGQELQDLEHAILNQDGTLAAPAKSREPPEESAVRLLVVPRQLPASIADFTGRDADIAEIKNRLGGAGEQYALRIVAISGKGGVGKSSLAIRVAHEVGDDFPDGHLYADLTAAGEDPVVGVLARFLRALGVSGSTIPDDPREREDLYRSKLAGRRVLVVLDDATGEEQVTPLLPGSATCAVIVTSRARLSGLSGASWIGVTVFDVGQSLDLLDRIIGRDRVRAEPAAANELVNRCGGLPLALRVAGARLAAKPHWRLDFLVRRLADEARLLDEFSHHGLELRANIGLTYRMLSKPAQRLFRLFALLRAPDSPAWTAAALLDTTLDRAEDVLEDLVDAQVLDTVEYPGSPRLRYRYHDLVRVFAWEQLVATETATERDEALGRVCGAWLALAERMHRKDYGGDYTILHGTAPRWRPADWADIDAVANPMEWWESERVAVVTAVCQSARAGLHELCWDLALISVDLFEAKGYFDDWREVTQIALDVTEAAGNRRGVAAMTYSLGTLHMFQKRLSEAEECFTRAHEMFTADDDTHGCALVLRNVALVDGLRGNTTAMLRKYTEALAMMRLVGDRMGEAQILRSLASHHIEVGAVALAKRLLDEALAICLDVRCLRGEAQVLYRFAELYTGTDQLELARHTLNRVLLIVREIGDRIGEAYVRYSLGVVRHREGRLDTAKTTLVHALSLARGLGERLVEGQTLYALGELELACGADPAAGTYLAAAGDLFADLGSAHWEARTLVLLSEVHASAGDREAARADIERARQLLLAMDSPETQRWLAHLERTRTALLTGETVDTP